MATVKNNTLLLFLLYFGQGLPYGFQVKLLPLLLRTQKFSLSKVSLSRLLSLPWIFKFAVAPFVDSVWSLHSWIMAGLLGMTVFCFIPAFWGVNNTLVLLMCIFGMNLTSAVQDVAVDVFAINHLRSSDLGIGSTLQVVGYKVGVLFAGGLLALLAVYCGWEMLFSFWGCFYIVLTILLSFHQKVTCNIHSPNSRLKKDRPKEFAVKKTDFVLPNAERRDKEINMHSNKNECLNNETQLLPEKEVSKLDVKRIISTVLETPHFSWLLFYVLTYKLGEQGMVSMFPLYIMDQGIPQDQVGLMFGIFGQLFSIAGSALGGWIVHHYSGKRTWVIRVLLWTSYARLVPLSSQWVLSLVGTTNPNMIITFECLVQLTSGIITTATFTLIMLSSQNSEPGTQASNSAILATAEVLGKLLMISFSGILVDLIGYQCFFGFCLCLACFTIPVVNAADVSPNKKLS